MKKYLKSLAILGLALVMCFCFSVPQGIAWAADQSVLRVITSDLNGVFSPYFAETAYDQDIVNLTSIDLLSSDRLGAIVEKGKTGETRTFNKKDYTYYGPADLTITNNPDGSVDYDFDLRKDIKFSDGEPLTADDVIFSMYVLCDPTYDGSSTFNALPIVGLKEYRAGMDTLANCIINAGPDNDDFTYWTEDQQVRFWRSARAASVAIAQEICDYCIKAGYNEAGDPVEDCAANWGYQLKQGATIADFGAAMMESYNNNIAELVSIENAGSSITGVFPDWNDYTVSVSTANSAPYITGIQKTGDYSLKVTTSEYSVVTLYQMAIPITPMHYYGDRSKYDYDNHKFGFDKGDLSSVRANTSAPMGAGPYKFIRYNKGTVYYEANDNYYLGAPNIKEVQFISNGSLDLINGIISNEFDVSSPAYSKDSASAIASLNTNGLVTGNNISTLTVDNNGYGYLGINAEVMSVEGKAGSDASKALRKAFATVYALYRQDSIDNYYGGSASVLNYPISNTSWAAPQKSEPGYTVAFSKDVSGNNIYKSDMTDAEKEKAALNAALGYFKAAGYTVQSGKVTEAPKGAKLKYEVWIPGDGTGDHPAYLMLTKAKTALAKIGITLIVKDLDNSAYLWSGLEEGTVPMWIAAWGSALDPDMYQIYYSGVNTGNMPGGSNYMYKIADPKLDEYILEARSISDQPRRKDLYKKCLDIIMDWAVEVPVYQRKNAYLFSTKRVDMSTVTDITSYYGWTSEIEKIKLNSGSTADKPVSIAKATITVKDQVYSGKKLTPKVTVKLNSKTLVKKTDYTVTYKNNTKVGKATVTIKGKGAYTGTVKASFKINPKPTSITGISAVKKGFTVKYKKGSNITGYEVQYSTSKKFTAGTKTAKVKSFKTTTKKVTGLKAKKTYYVRVRTYTTVSKKPYYSAWSKVKSIKTK